MTHSFRNRFRGTSASSIWALTRFSSEGAAIPASTSPDRRGEALASSSARVVRWRFGVVGVIYSSLSGWRKNRNERAFGPVLSPCLVTVLLFAEVQLRQVQGDLREGHDDAESD